MEPSTRQLAGAALAGACAAAGCAWVVQRCWRRRRRRAEWERETAAASKDEVLAARRELFCAAQSVSYSNTEPLMVVQGRGHTLVTEDGTEFLDTRNNVGHVGWQNPDVVAAVQRQIAATNSNTRYLHPNAAVLAKRLLATFPDPLCKVFFVNSGSEANDLALRLAAAHTRVRTGGARREGDCIVVERAYHGHTTAVIDISPYKFSGKGGQGRRDWVQVVPCPEAYRGRAPGESEAAFSARCAAHVEAACEAIEARGAAVGAFFIESGMSVAGVIMPPARYLARAYESVRRRGGLCVADEVQVGFGRFGDHFWGFQQQGVVPDVVTFGKPFGNGFPLAGVVCTQAVADAFTNGMEYFNTFGGNPVACAAGLAVLDALDAGGLQAAARRTGAYLRERLAALQARPEGALIGDVRGAGLFVGIELVRDRESKEPASKEASVVTTRLVRRHRILTSLDGAHDNVLVLKPPLTFDEEAVDTFVEALGVVLRSLDDVDWAAVQRTPT